MGLFPPQAPYEPPPLEFPPGYRFEFKVTSTKAEKSALSDWMFSYEWRLYHWDTVVRTNTYFMRIEANVQDEMEQMAYNEAAEHFNEVSAIKKIPYEVGKTYSIAGSIEKKDYLRYEQWPKE